MTRVAQVLSRRHRAAALSSILSKWREGSEEAFVGGFVAAIGAPPSIDRNTLTDKDFYFAGLFLAESNKTAVLGHLLALTDAIEECGKSSTDVAAWWRRRCPFGGACGRLCSCGDALADGARAVFRQVHAEISEWGQAVIGLPWAQYLAMTKLAVHAARELSQNAEAYAEQVAATLSAEEYCDAAVALGVCVVRGRKRQRQTEVEGMCACLCVCV